ncbi:unnamed protein product [Cuscuta campestris]|uniref:Retrotransposon gag domain-containing protein n=1 Tax=Cuscuta campestris TaxID=132261 RepID=A0A484NQW8_9ASTE|nr:unnamed protein product [Cuscuta campestris]
MASKDVPEAVLREFQEQFDRQLLSQTSAMQTLTQTVEKLQRQVEMVSARVDKSPPSSSGLRHHDQGSVMSKLKLDMPKTDGTDPIGWLFKAHEYFTFYGVADELRLPAVSLMLEGAALDWFRWRQRNHSLSSWPDFVTKFKLRFDPINYVDFLGVLSKVQQTGSVLAYQEAFEKVLVNVTNVDEAHLQSLFHAGLKPHLQHDVMLHKPDSLSASFALAREFELKHQAWTATLSHRPVPFRESGAAKPSGGPSQAPLLPTPGSKPVPNPQVSPNPPIRRLSFVEKKERDAKGLCYNCDEKWVKGHRCGRFLLLLEDDEDTEDSAPSPADDTVISADVSSLHSLAGVSAPRSLRLSGMLSEVVVDVLIDSGSTHNFIQPSIVEKLRLSVREVAPFRVYVGNGASLVCTHQCCNLDILLQGFCFTVDVFVLPIHGPNMVLGVQWLRLLGKVTHDYDKLTMDFVWQGRPVALQGDSLSLRPLSLHNFYTLNAGQGIAECYEIVVTPQPGDSLEQTTCFPADLPPEILAVLQQHGAVFAQPSGVFPLPDDLVDGRPPSHPVQIHATRWVLRRGVREEQYLVSWSDSTLDDATWEPAALIREHYPHLHLEDKVVSEGRESDTDGSTREGLPSLDE